MTATAGAQLFSTAVTGPLKITPVARFSGRAGALLLTGNTYLGRIPTRGSAACNNETGTHGCAQERPLYTLGCWLLTAVPTGVG
jgi:hypothetical protein